MNTKNKIIAILMASIVTISIVAMAVPTMGSKNAESKATVGNQPPVVVSVTPDTNVGLNPCPTNTMINVTAEVSDMNGAGDIKFVNITGSNASAYIAELPGTVTMEETDQVGNNATYKATLNLTCCIPVGTYNMTVEAKDNNGSTDSKDGTFVVLSTTAVELNFTKVGFSGNAGQNNVSGVEKNATGVEVDSTIQSMGNDPINISVNATDLVNATLGTIGGNNMSAIIGGNEQTLNNTWVTNLGCTNKTSVAFELNIPNVKPGEYNGTIIISPL